MNFEPGEKGVPIRMPSIANLMADSADRNEAVYPNPFDFQITKNNSLMNGFFTRIATSEVCLEWKEPNGKYIQPISGVANGASTFNVVFEDTSYNVSTALGFLASTINQQTGAGVYIDTSGTPFVNLTAPDDFSFNDTPGVQQLGIQAPTTSTTDHPIIAPDLRPFRYLDFVSQQLTYNQEVKDNSTGPLSRDVLCRWYMAWDNPPSYDGLGFPILQGYTEFVERRLFNPPKQIKWSPNMPCGNISFQVYGNGQSVPVQADQYANSQFLMTLQFSEV